MDRRNGRLDGRPPSERRSGRHAPGPRSSARDDPRRTGARGTAARAASVTMIETSTAAREQHSSRH